MIRCRARLTYTEVDAILSGLADRAVKYLEERAGAEIPFFLYFPLTSPHEPIAPSGSFSGKSGMNALADFVIETDAVVGRVMEAVDRLGLSKDTLLFFTADNGSSMYTGGKELVAMGHDPHAGFRGAKTSIYEGGHRIPFFARWPDRIPAGSRSTCSRRRPRAILSQSSGRPHDFSPPGAYLVSVDTRSTP